MKISIITAVFNGENYLADCISSVSSQTHQNIEYIVVDGNSTDRTPNIIANHQSTIAKVISEADLGLYDAINKGLEVATGDVIGLLNSDDMFADGSVVAKIAEAFEQNLKIDCIYGDLDYIHPQSRKILRRWRSKQVGFRALAQGWMPAHPTLYLRKSVITKHGNYSLNYGTAADYDFILRYFYTHKVACKYLPFLMIKMRQGGVSNQSMASRISALLNDYKALVANKLPFPIYVLLLKKITKFSQYFR
ncbi:glycosyltransferase involved in cell wall biosynthesis [Pedobacter sp. UYP30]|uniref:glycosyltransferase family 2 protein n=1 Tax=Pedobacter sp. UYP30 TaxID=1756400 RepID=UPI003391E64F